VGSSQAFSCKVEAKSDFSHQYLIWFMIISLS